MGERFFLHCTGVGKAILAFLPPAESRRIVAEEVLPSFFPTTITYGRALERELAEVQSRGFAVDRSEHELCTYCVAAPIFDARGGVLGACSVSGSNPEIIGSRLPELASRVIGATEEISRRMGYVPVRPALQVVGKTSRTPHYAGVTRSRRRAPTERSQKTAR